MRECERKRERESMWISVYKVCVCVLVGMCSCYFVCVSVCVSAGGDPHQHN